MVGEIANQLISQYSAAPTTHTLSLWITLHDQVYTPAAYVHSFSGLSVIAEHVIVLLHIMIGSESVVMW